MDAMANLTRPLLWLVVLCLAVSSCAPVPEGHEVIEEAKAQKAAPKIVGATGPLTTEESQTLIKDISEDDLLKRHLAIEQAVAETPLVADNHTRILRDGKETFRAIFAAIKSAKYHINLEYYILQDVRSGGVHLSDALVQKLSEGVEVNIIYDSFGSSDTDAAFFEKLRKAGARIVEFNPLNPLMANDSPNDRNHRKIAVIDGATGITGGINLSDTYEASDIGKSTGPDGTAQAQWHDVDIEIRGPAVAQLEALFLAHWNDQKGPPIDTRTFFPKSKDKGEEIVRIIGSTPDKAIPRYYVTLLSAIRNSRDRVWLMTGYFVPTDESVQDLIAAAERGVDVRLVLPGQSDSSLAVAVQHTHYGDLLEAGVKIYELHNWVLHSKMNVIDSVWTTVGSSNLDYRSVIYNDEVDTVIIGKKTAQEAEAVFIKDFERAHQVTLKEWRTRPIDRRIYETFSLLWERLL